MKPLHLVTLTVVCVLSAMLIDIHIKITDMNKAQAQQECPYEFGECPNDDCANHIDDKDYQLQLHNDTIWVYDGKRLVAGYVNKDWTSQLDSIILKDNE